MQPLDINMADEDLNMDTDAIALEDTQENSVENESSTTALTNYVMSKYKKSEDYRYDDEQRWVRAYRNYRGLYGPDVQFTEAEKSRVFIKVTKTKTLAAYGQIVDVLFANNKFPLSVDPTELPEGVAKDVNFDPKDPEYITLYEELKRLFNSKNINQVSQDEMRRNIMDLEKIYARVKELNRINETLRDKYKGDKKYVRIQKRLIEAGKPSKLKTVS